MTGASLVRNLSYVNLTVDKPYAAYFFAAVTAVEKRRITWRQLIGVAMK